MHKLFININVILDVALAREPHLISSQKILSHIEKKKAFGYLSAISCTTIYYLIQKEDSRKSALNYTRDLLKLLSVVEVNKKTLERGLELEPKDPSGGTKLDILCCQKLRIRKDRDGANLRT